MKTIHDLNYKVYKLPSPAEHVCNLSAALIHTLDSSKVLQEVFEDTIFENVDTADIRELLQYFDYNTCKIVLVGNDILTNENMKNVLGEKLTNEIQTEKWFKSKYRLHKKQTLNNCKLQFSEDEWENMYDHIYKQPSPNKFIPQDPKPIVERFNQRKNNPLP